MENRERVLLGQEITEDSETVKKRKRLMEEGNVDDFGDDESEEDNSEGEYAIQDDFLQCIELDCTEICITSHRHCVFERLFTF